MESKEEVASKVPTQKQLLKEMIKSELQPYKRTTMVLIIIYIIVIIFTLLEGVKRAFLLNDLQIQLNKLTELLSRL